MTKEELIEKIQWCVNLDKRIVKRLPEMIHIEDNTVIIKRILPYRFNDGRFFKRTGARKCEVQKPMIHLITRIAEHYGMETKCFI